MSEGAAFDAYARSYDDALAKGLAVTGEGKEYFAGGRVTFLAARLREAGVTVKTVLDYGCGTGATTPLLRERLGAERAIGVDVSEESVAVARERHAEPRIEYSTTREARALGDVDLVYCNGIFHHIPPRDRAGALAEIRRVLAPGGWFALWENNPWNPGTRWVMSRIPFDRDAETLSAPAARRLVEGNGFRVDRTDFLFIFPRALRFLRGLEPRVSRLPLGAQYQVLSRAEP